MGLSPAVGKKCWPRPFRFPRSRPKPASRTAEEPMGSQMLVQLAPKQPTQGPLEQDRSLQQGEKLVVNLETTPNQKRAELDSSLKSESAGKLAKQAAEGRPRPRPGDLIEIFRIGYEHWAIYVEDDRVVHLAPPCDEFEAFSITSIFSNRAVVKYSRLEDVLHGCSWKINNKLDGTYLPLPADKIVQRTKNMINKIVQYSLIEGNCEHFVNDLRYGVPRSQQVGPRWWMPAAPSRRLVSPALHGDQCFQLPVAPAGGLLFPQDFAVLFRSVNPCSRKGSELHSRATGGAWRGHQLAWSPWSSHVTSETVPSCTKQG
uniref:LRAT domain-containing protein n=1 Tax=Molossus molossus TaxID=27622 RepID=A0A7J8ERI8_MOLMO|nr:hypothetical protein HJG59_006456 [Molossus molossus]